MNEIKTCMLTRVLSLFVVVLVSFLLLKQLVHLLTEYLLCSDITRSYAYWHRYFHPKTNYYQGRIQGKI